VKVGKWVRDNFASVLTIIVATAAFVTGAALAQRSIEDLEENDAAQDLILAEIPKIAGAVDAIAATVSTLAADQKTFMEKVDTYIKEDIREDAKNHHTHRGNP
jgi:hypothetical protein